MPKVIHITDYDYNFNKVIDNDVEEIMIDYLTYPLNNIPPSVNQIIIKHQRNIFKKAHKIPYNCKLIIENTAIVHEYPVCILTKIKDGDYSEIQEHNYLEITKFIFLNTKIEKFPEIIFNLTNLRELKLNNIKIKEIPHNISHLTNLQILCLNSNDIKEIPESIKYLINLQKLYLYNNQLDEIPCHITSLVNLQILDLGRNPIKEIPDHIVSLIKLKYLSLTDTPIKKITTNIALLPRLQRLHLSMELKNETPELLKEMNIEISYY